MVDTNLFEMITREYLTTHEDIDDNVLFDLVAIATFMGDTSTLGVIVMFRSDWVREQGVNGLISGVRDRLGDVDGLVGRVESLFLEVAGGVGVDSPLFGVDERDIADMFASVRLGEGEGEGGVVGCVGMVDDGHPVLTNTLDEAVVDNVKSVETHLGEFVAEVAGEGVVLVNRREIVLVRPFPLSTRTIAREIWQRYRVDPDRTRLGFSRSVLDGGGLLPLYRVVVMLVGVRG